MAVRPRVVGVVAALSVLAGCSAGGAQQPSEAAPVEAVGAVAAAPAAQPVTVGRQVVRSATVEIAVDDLFAATDRARRVAPGYGGFVAAERSGPQTSSLTLRVAADDLDAALTALAALGEVSRRELRAEDVTEQAVDLQARVETQRASVQRVRALLDRAGTIGEIVQVESELTWRQAELESLQQRMAALADSVALATVEVSLTGTGRDAPGGFGAGLAAGWDALRAAGTNLLTVLGAVLPFAVLLAVPAAAAALWWRRRTSTVRG